LDVRLPVLPVGRQDEVDLLVGGILQVVVIIFVIVIVIVIVIFIDYFTRREPMTMTMTREKAAPPELA